MVLLLVRIHRLKSLMVIADMRIISFGGEGTNRFRLTSKQKALLELAFFAAFSSSAKLASN